MVSILFVLSKDILGKFCGVYTGLVPRVTHRATNFPLRKIAPTYDAPLVHYWITETQQDIVDLHLIIRLLGVYAEFSDDPDSMEGTLDKIVLVGFPFCDYETPEWLTQPTSPGDLQTSTGLKLQSFNRESILALFKAVQPTDNIYIHRSPRVPILQRNDFNENAYINGCDITNSPLRNHLNAASRSGIVDLTQLNSNNNINNEIFNRILRQSGLPTIDDLTDARNVSTVKRKIGNANSNDNKEKEEKKRKLLSQLKLAEDKVVEKVTDENRCCVCYEDFYDPLAESEDPERKEENEKYGDNIFVVPVALVPCQHRLCVNCVQRLRDTATKIQCPLCKSAIEAWETYHCVSCLEKKEVPKGPNIVVARPCEHRVWCKFCAESAIKEGTPICPLCLFPVDDIRVAKEYK